MIQKTEKKVPRKTPLFPERLRLSEEELSKRRSEDEAFALRCREIFWRVYPELVKEYYNWFIHIEPNSGDYFIDPDEEVSFQKAREKHPTADVMAMRLNETGTCGKI
ncbi:MAG: hypothetical protein DSM107014_10445 [Gomphosphaeria aponina SAG 52.96 = DSM 107014]|uniref:Uncharacterized protein n=1 Tax=Gomphosphaeria aponina SAG 52.96 = DSM 107014 TaxID=1521640 RepID=A0A941JSE2_9CHRO|nr:hypothetical protein [Gomphosphaeria aponina SAG 52.96 = DSM 107014]